MTMSNESASHDITQLLAEATSLEPSWPSEDQETIDPPTFDFGDLVDPLPELPELESTFPAFDNTASINRAETHEREHVPPDNYLHVQPDISTVERELRELRHTTFTLQQRLNVHDCILPQLQQE